MTEIGDELIIKNEIFCIYTGNILLKKGEKVIVRDLEYWSHSGRWSKLCPDIWNPKEISLVKLEGHEGVTYTTSTFENIIVK